ncbi:hypothetical protein [Microcoleus sp. N9_A1]|uniref:hypothetical protein n=1 Tax=Microcoleus sp. N9_A1 TaxID=3055380 RepID=UPI002FD077CF
MAPDKLFTRIHLESQTKSLGDNLRKILQRIKSIAITRYVVEGNNKQSAEHDWLLGELDKVEAQIKELISRCDAWIKGNQYDIDKIKKERTKILQGKADNKQAMAKNIMIAEKESEINFLKSQTKRLKDDLDFLNKEENRNKRYRYRYRLVERKPAVLAYSTDNSQIKNKENIRIEALDKNSQQKGRITATFKENGTVFIVWTEAIPTGEGTGSLLYKALENLFSPGTVIYFKENKEPLFWLKMRFMLKPFDGEEEAKYYWKRVSS